MKFFLIVALFLIPALICQEAEPEVSDLPAEENLENLEEGVNEAEPVEVALPEATEGPKIVAVETTSFVNQTSPVKGQTNETSGQEKDAEVNSKNLIGNSASFVSYQMVSILLTISAFVFV